MSTARSGSGVNIISPPSGARAGQAGGDVGGSDVTPYHFLCFGDVVQLFCDNVAGSGVGGYMGADGFADGQCEIRRVLDVDTTTEVIDNLFRVCTKMQSECSKRLAEQLAKSLEDVPDSTGQSESENANDKHAKIDLEDAAAIERFRQEAHSEAIANAYELERCQGHVVQYGQIIQLVHVKSGKFLTIRSKEVADAESWCQRVSLSAYGGPDAWWMMEPGYRAAGICEPVRYGDSVSISSGKTLGFMLHTAKIAIRDMALEGEPCEYYEVNAYNVDVKTAWKFHCYTPFMRLQERSIQGGNIVQLLHVELDAFLAHGNALPGVDAGSVYMRERKQTLCASTLWRIEHEERSNGRPFSFGEVCRLRHLLSDQYIALRIHGVSMVSSKEAVPQTMLQVIGSGAHKEGQIAGERLLYFLGCDAKVYLHPQTAMRTTEIAKAEVSRAFLMQDAFRIVKVDPDIVSDCYHAASIRTALHRFHKVQHRLGENTESNEARSMRTRYSFRHATRIVIDLVDFMCGKDLTLRAQTGYQTNHLPLSSLQMRRHRQALVSEIALLEDLMDTTVLMQKMMKPLLNSDQSIIISTSPRRNDPNGLDSPSRSGGVTEWISRTTDQDTSQVSLHAALKLYSAAHKAIQAAIIENAHNVESLLEFVPILLQQMTAGQRLHVDARNTLDIMLSCESTLKEMIPLSVIEFFINGIDTEPGAREEYIKCLSKLLCNEGTGIKRNQDIILHRWLLDKRRNQLLFDTISPEKGIVQVRIRAEPGGALDKNNSANPAASRSHINTAGGILQPTTLPKPLGSVRIIDVEALATSPNDRHLYQIYIAQLDLLQKLCMGCNHEARAVIGDSRQLMSYDALLQCLVNERLPSRLRFLYTRLMLTLYMEVTPVDRVLAIQTVFGISDMKSEDFGLPGAQVCANADDGDHRHHQLLRKEVSQCLGHKSTFNLPDNDDGESHLTLALLELTQEMTARGYYSDEALLRHELIPTLMNVLDFSTDTVKLPVDPRLGETERVLDRHLVCTETMQMMRSKLVASNLMHQVCDFRLTIRLQRMLKLFKDMMWDKVDGPCRRANSMLFAGASFSGNTNLREGPSRRNKSPACIKVIMDLASDLKDTHILMRIKETMDYMPLMYDMDQARFIRIMLDNMRCQMHELARSSLELLIRDRSPNMELYLQLFDTQILKDSKAERDFRTLETKVNQLRRLANPFQVTVSSERDPHRLNAQQREQLLTVLADLTEMCSPDYQGQPLSREAAGRSWLSKECMRRLNTHNIVIEMLSWCMTPFGNPGGYFVGAEVSMSQFTSSQELKSSHAERMDLNTTRWLVRECLPAMFEFLEHYCRGMPRNQIAVSPHVVLISSFLRWGVSGVPQALSGIYESNKSLCERLDTRVIDIVVDYLAYGPSGTANTSTERMTSGDTVAGRSYSIDPFGVSTRSKGGKDRSSNKDLISRKPVFDVLCLQFLETTFNVEGEMVRANQRYVLNSIATHGPVSIDGKDGDSKEHGDASELVLQLFRGKRGEQVRDKARKARAGVQDPVNDVLEYNIALLRLLRFLALDVGPVDKDLLRSLVDPGRLAQDVCGTASLARAKAFTLDLFCTLFLTLDLRQKSSSTQTQEALWVLLEYLEGQLRVADERALAISFERSHGGDTLADYVFFSKGEQAERRINEELELLLANHWAPMLDAVLNDAFLLEVMSDSNCKTLESIFRRLLQLMQTVHSCAPLDDLDSPRDPAEKIKVRESFVTIQALWQKLTNMQHPPFRVPVVEAGFINMKQMEYELHQRELRKKQKLPKYTFQRPKEPRDSLVTNRQLQCFAQALLNVIDPIVREDDYDLDEPLSSDPEGVNEDNENGSASGEEDSDDDGHEEFPGPEVRGELVEMCKVLYDGLSFVCPGDSRQSGHELLTPMDSLVDIIRTRPDDQVKWECQTMLLLRVLRGMVVHWQRSVTDSLPPKWLLRSIPELIVEIIGIKDTRDRIVMMALELGIVTLQVSPPAPVQQSFYDVLVSSGRRSSDFMGELLMRMRRGEEEAILARNFWDIMHIPGSVADPAKLLDTVKKYEGRLRGRARCVHLQMVQARRGEVHPTSHVETIFRFLQLLCEGHNYTLQNYLRTQTKSNSIRSVDLVSATANFVISSTPHICPLNISTPLRALQALAEYVQNPCRANQRVIVDTALVASANSLLNLNSNDENDMSESKNLQLGNRLSANGTNLHTIAAEMAIQFVEDYVVTECRSYQEGINALKAATITCLLSLLECVDEPYIPGRMLETLGDDPLRLNMNALVFYYNPELVEELRTRIEIDELLFSNHKARSEPSDEQRDAAREVAQQFYITYISLASFDTTGRFQEGLKREKIWDIDSLRKTVGAIEISRSGIVEKAYFIIPRLCQYLTRTSKQQILMGVNRANLQTMLTGFSEAFDSLYEEMKHQQKLTEKRVLNFFRVTLDWREKFFFYNAVLINLLLLLFYNYQCNQTFICGDNEDLIYYRIKPGWSELVVVLSCVQCLFAITRQWWYVIERGVPMVKSRIAASSKSLSTNWLWAMIVWLPTELADPIYRHMPRHSQSSILGLSLWRLHFVQVVYMCTDLKFWTITAQTVVNILAILIKHEGAKLLLLVHLLEIFAHSVVLQNVMRSITYRGNTLLQTAGLALVMIYFFGVVGFILFPELFQFEEADIMGGRKLDPNNNGARCTSIWKCSLVVLDMGLRKGDLGEAMDDIGWNGGESGDTFRIFYRMLYTLLFFIIVSTILMNIIFGVIIDTFAELRARKDEIDRDISGRCFICGIDRFVFDQIGDGGNGFETHITEDHNMWKYLYFNVYLRLKDFDDYSGGESYVFSRTLELVRDPHTHTPLRDVDTGLELKRPLQQIDLMWLPQKMAMRLKQQKVSMDQRLQEKMKSLISMIYDSTKSLNTGITKALQGAGAHGSKAEPLDFGVLQQKAHGVHV
jgi:hypothetical protein